MKKIIVGLILICSSFYIFGASVLQNEDTTYGSYGMHFKYIDASVKANAMGSSYICFSDDAFLSLYNPAGLSDIKSHNIGASFTWMQDNRMFVNAAYISPFQKFGSLTIGANLFILGGIQGYDSSMEKTKSINYIEGAGFLGYGISIFKGFSLGIRGDFLFTAISGTGSSAFGYNFGLGIKYRFYTDNALRYLRLALTVDNIPGFSGVPQIFWNNTVSKTSENLSMNIKTGIAYSFLKDKLKMTSEIILYPGLISKNSKVLTYLDYNIGLEFTYNIISIRLGGNHYRYSAGLGITLKKQISIDYSFTWDGYGMVHMISAQGKFGGQIEEVKRSQIMQEIINNKAIGSYNDGMFEYKNNHYKAALKFFQMALLWDPMMTKADDMIKNLESKLAKEKQTTEEASKKNIKEIERIKKGTCPSANTLLKMYYDGINLYMQGDIQAALNQWKEILRCDPENEKVKLNIKKAEITLKQMTN